MRSRKAENSCYATRGFTLIELLVVIAILSILVAVLMPTLCRAREIARKRVCQTRLKDIHTAAMQRSADYLGYVAKAVAKECYVVTKAGMVGNEGIRADDGWGFNDLDNHYWQRDYPLHYMGLAEGYFATAFACPSQSEEEFVNEDWNRLTWEGQRQTDQGQGIGYGMTQTVWDAHMAPIVPLPGGNFLVAQGWWPGKNSDGDYAADHPNRYTSRTYVRGLNAVSNLVAFGDSTAQQCNAGNYGFRHHGGCGYQDWYKNVVFWDGHVGDDQYLESKDENWYDELILAGGG
jgi:prepilin-type N-terminal cleavage/methylation domain-containing protein/prepilin-type processing-associated H-X9-DG protein